MPSPQPESAVVVGCGSIGRRHAHNLRAAGVTALQLVDEDVAAAEALAHECGGRMARSLDDALEQGVAAAFICTPSNLHLNDATRAAAAGVDLFIEKPLSHSLEGLDELMAAVESRGLVTMVGCNMRFHPGPRAVKRLIDEGAIGTVVAARIHTGSYLPRWRPSQDYRRGYSASTSHGGAILDCIHEIDLALWYFGPASLHSCAAVAAWSIGLTTDGLAELLLRHEHGVLASVHLNFIQRDYSRSCLVIGTEGTIEWVFRDREVRVFAPDGALRERCAEPASWEMNQMYVDEIGHFLAAARRRTATMNPIRGGVAALQLAIEARRRAGEVAL